MYKRKRENEDISDISPANKVQKIEAYFPLVTTNFFRISFLTTPFMSFLSYFKDSLWGINSSNNLSQLRLLKTSGWHNNCSFNTLTHFLSDKLDSNELQRSFPCSGFPNPGSKSDPIFDALVTQPSGVKIKSIRLSISRPKSNSFSFSFNVSGQLLSNAKTI